MSGKTTLPKSRYSILKNSPWTLMGNTWNITILSCISSSTGLEEIDPNTLLVFNECLRTQKRSDLTYNCAHHYCNQTPHKIVFEYFPFIEDKADFMILLDFLNKGKYKGKGFSWEFLQEEDVQVKPISFTLHTIDMIAPNLMGYERKKRQLFANLGNSDPDTIPRQCTSGPAMTKSR